jgi:hypothetical protein
LRIGIDCRDQLFRHRMHIPRAAQRLHSWSRTIGGKVEHVRHTGQVLLPPRQPCVEFLHLFALRLPRHNVTELHGERRQRRRLARAERAIQRRKLAPDDVQRPTVRDDVMDGDEQAVILTRSTHPNQRHPHQRRGGQIEGPHRFAVHDRFHGCFIGGVVAFEIEGHILGDVLLRYAVDGYERGTQRFVAADDFAEGAQQRVLIEKTEEALVIVDVVGAGVLRLHALEEPHPQLRGRERQRLPGIAAWHARARRRLSRKAAQQQRALLGREAGQTIG